MEELIYLASPYSHPDGFIRHCRFLAAMKVTADLLRAGRIVYSPIVHCHEMAREHSFPTEFAFWQNYNFAMIRKSSEFMVLKMPGWEHSHGLFKETEYAKGLNLRMSETLFPYTDYSDFIRKYAEERRGEHSVG